ncbi:glycosyltransferase family 4 protein [bacterium]|nr:glycosyltransferase family 4 protein [bacterium]
MKVAVIMGQVSSGGISRFQKLLLSALINNFDDLDIDVYAGRNIIKRDNLKELENYGDIKILAIEDFGIKEVDVDKVNPENKRSAFSVYMRDTLKKISFVKKTYFYLKKSLLGSQDSWYEFRLSKELEEILNDYDIIYLPSAGFIKPFETRKPVVVTFHDFNWKHKDFKGNFDDRMMELLESQLAIWFKKYKRIISSSKFIQEELKEYYPEAYSRSRVVYLSTLGNVGSRKFDLGKYLAKFNLPKKYILYPARIAAHKNVLNLIKGFDILSKNGFNYSLILSGDSTDKLSKEYKNISKSSPLRKINKFLSGSSLEINKNIFALGYVSDEEIDALIQGASLVISPSLYEAGSGPGVDSWNVETPVALSNISSHLE